MTDGYRRCTFCVMDTTDSNITFDVKGRCQFCKRVEDQLGKTWFRDASGEPVLRRLLDRIKGGAKRSKHDCIIGLSGGVDSSFLLLKAKEWGLNPLVFHVDAGWNSELAVQNIEKLLEHTGFELHTHVVNWPAMRELQLAYFRSGVANQDVPQDHVFFATLYKYASRHRVKYVLSGGNVATEGVSPSNWQWPPMDRRNLRAINRRFGNGRLRGYPSVGLLTFYVWLPLVRGVKPVRPLNFIPYSKAEATAELEKIGWRAYPRKHGESIFTRFTQDYYLPEKFGIDMRLPHLSSLIASGQVTRGDALATLAEPLYDLAELERDKAYIARKLQISTREFEEILKRDARPADSMPNWGRQYRMLKRTQTTLARLTGRNYTIYS